MTGVSGLATRTNVGTTADTLSAATGAGLGNYTISYANGSLTITPAALTLNAVTATKMYDGTILSTGTVGVVGLVGGDTVTGLGQSYASKNVLGANGSTLGINAGYVVNDGNGGANYTVTSNTARGTITPASLVIAADDASRPFSTPNPPFTASYAGFVAGEGVANLGGALSFLTAATTASVPGNYPVTPYGQTSGNYAISYRDGTLTVVGVPVPPTGPAGRGETAADQQAIGAQYTSQGMPDVVLGRIRYVLGDDVCKEGTALPDVSCDSIQGAASVVRMVNGGILLPRQ